MLPVSDGRRRSLGGLLATVRRNPLNARRASVAAIAAGAAVFVAAALATPLAGADSAASKHPKPEHAATPLATSSTTAASGPALATTAASTLAPAAPAAKKTIKRKPTVVKQVAAVDPTTISGLAANGIPNVALNAYRVAAARMANVEPSCGIDWALLAGIGREESDHGQFGGAVLHADGISTPEIIGPALDGVHWDYIPAPGNGVALDGDAKFAHALGPMQFIPSTWAIYGADADGDGKADIFDINDAALGTARYLCAAGGNLRTQAGQVAGVLAYNHSNEYLAQVLALANAYRTGVTLTGLPVGITTGALPTVADTGYVPPANPGGPTAVDRAKAKQRAAARARARARARAKARARARARARAHHSPSPTPSGTKSRTTAPTRTTSPTAHPSSPHPSPKPTPTSTPTSSPSSSSTPTPTPSSSGNCVLGLIC